MDLLTVFLIFAPLKDLKAPLVNRVMKETEAVDSFDGGTRQGGIMTWQEEEEEEIRQT